MVCGDKYFDSFFEIETNKHPKIVKEFLKKNLSLETLIILDRILGFSVKFDKKMRDPVWKLISQRMKKYSSFLNSDVFRYKKILKEVIL